ncbi:hypothetical protein GCM10029963_69210 [Micromonospora andamanensis]
MGAVQARQGEIEEACATWSRALDAMEGVRSGRTREVAVEMRAILSPTDAAASERSETWMLAPRSTSQPLRNWNDQQQKRES